MQGDRYNKGKTKWSLVDWESLEPFVQVLMFGANKYAPYNWQKGLKVTETLESCLRHIFSFLSGEDNDKESGLTHLGHAMCNLHFATWMLKHRPDMDDRPKRKDTQLKLNLFDEPLTTSEKRCTEISSRDSSLYPKRSWRRDDISSADVSTIRSCRSDDPQNVFKERGFGSGYSWENIQRHYTK